MIFYTNSPLKYAPHFVVLITFFLFFINIASYLLVLQSTEGLLSSIRMFFEAVIIFSIVRYKLIKLNYLINFIVLISVINSILVIIQVIEGLGYINTNLNSIIDYWGINNEMMRKPGLFNSILTSSYIIFFGLILNLLYRPKFLNYFFVIQVFALFFSARTFLMPVFLMLPILFIHKFSINMLFKVIVIFILSFIAFGYIDASFVQSLIDHFNERVSPAINVIVGLDLTEDYSSKDLVSHYRLPTVSEFVIGNGFPRYSELGGKDPTYMRWLLQAGILSVILIFLLHVLLFVLSCYKKNIFHMILGLVFFFTPLKGELTTATLLFSITFLYFILAAKSNRCVLIDSNSLVRINHRQSIIKDLHPVVRVWT